MVWREMYENMRGLQWLERGGAGGGGGVSETNFLRVKL